jgi:hypothetical protein
MLNVTLTFCLAGGGNGGCCDANADAALQERFDSMGVKPGGACGHLIKSILCSVLIFSNCFLVSKLAFNLSPVDVIIWIRREPIIRHIQDPAFSFGPA